MQTEIVQVPEVIPAGMSQDKPEQQSVVEVQTLPCGLQTGGGAQVSEPPSSAQMSEQHWADELHVLPFDTQPPSVGSWQAVPLPDVPHTEPEQQSVPPSEKLVQLEPIDEQLSGGAQTRS
jgi:hypothetical protein